MFIYACYCIKRYYWCGKGTKLVLKLLDTFVFNIQLIINADLKCVSDPKAATTYHFYISPFWERANLITNTDVTINRNILDHINCTVVLFAGSPTKLPCSGCERYFVTWGHRRRILCAHLHACMHFQKFSHSAFRQVWCFRTTEIDFKYWT